MFRFLALALLLALASAYLENEFAIFKFKHDKQYKDSDEELYRFYVYQANKQYIAMKNKRFANGKTSYFLEENKYSDMTTEEFNRVMNGLRLPKKPTPGKFESGLYKGILPSSVDWRTKGYVTPVKNQGQCGSCWAFSAAGALEGAHKKSKGQLVSLSESNLVDCSQRWGNLGCDGGLMDNAFQYVIDEGLDTEVSYPYVDRNRPCKFNKKTIGTHEKSFTDITSGSEDALQQAVATIGPVSVAIDASHPSFHQYGGGIYDEPGCSTSAVDHGVLVVGYGTEGGKDYWLVKNSWSDKWGEKGYIRMSRNKGNQCGIATMASYPIV